MMGAQGLQGFGCAASPDCLSEPLLTRPEDTRRGGVAEVEESVNGRVQVAEVWVAVALVLAVAAAPVPCASSLAVVCLRRFGLATPPLRCPRRWT